MPVLERLPGPDDEERSNLVDMAQPLEVIVTSIKHIECIRLIRDGIHAVDVVDLRIGDVKDRRHMGLQIKERMYLDSSFGASEMSPVINTEAQVNCRRVKGIDLSARLEDIRYLLLLSHLHRVIGKLLKDAIVAGAVRFRKVAAHYVPAQSAAVKLLLDGLGRRNEAPQRGLPGQLAAHQRQKLIPAGEILDVLVSFVLHEDAKKYKLVEDLYKLGENVRTYIHGGRISSAKLSSNRCALKILATF